MHGVDSSEKGKMNCIDAIFIITQYHTPHGHVGLITYVLNWWVGGEQIAFTHQHFVWVNLKLV